MLAVWVLVYELEGVVVAELIVEVEMLGDEGGDVGFVLIRI